MGRVSIFIDGSNLYHGLKGAVDMLSMAFHNAYGTAVLVSSDGDFVKVIEAVRDLGKHVEVACFGKAYHVKQAADKVIELNQSFLAPLWMKRQ